MITILELRAVEFVILYLCSIKAMYYLVVPTVGGEKQLSAILQVVGSGWSALGLGTGFFYETKKKLILSVIGKAATVYALMVFTALILDVTLPTVPFIAVVVDGLQNVVIRVGWGGLNFAVFHIVGKEFGRSFNNAK